MKYRTKILLWVFLGVLFLNACRKDSGPYYVEPEGRDTTPVSYLKDIQPIFDKNCTSCHNETHQRLDLRACCSYNELINKDYVDGSNPRYTVLILELKGDILPGMPLDQSPLPQSQIDLIMQWIKEGGKNN